MTTRISIIDKRTKEVVETMDYDGSTKSFWFWWSSNGNSTDFEVKEEEVDTDKEFRDRDDVKAVVKMVDDAKKGRR